MVRVHDEAQGNQTLTHPMYRCFFCFRGGVASFLQAINDIELYKPNLLH